MTRILARRLPIAIGTLLLSSFLVYSALYLAPGDPVTTLTGGHQLDPQAIAALRAEYNLDQPYVIRYFKWLGGVGTGNLGKSAAAREQPVSGLLASRAVTTGLLLLMASTFIIVIGLGLGIVGGLKAGLVRTLIIAASGMALAIPSFIAATILIAVFAVQLGWFPVFGPGQGISDRLWHLTLPAIALSLSAVAYVAQQTRTAVEREDAREHVLTANARGLPSGWLLRKHVLRNAAIPMATVSGLTIGYLLVGTAVVEKAFAIEGIGSLLVDSVAKRDFAVVQAICLLVVAGFVTINLILDVLYPFLDPRLRNQ